MKRTLSLLLVLALCLVLVPLRESRANSYVTITGQFRQTEARSMLAMINQFRTCGGPNGYTTGEETWYWNADDTTKTTFGSNELDPYKYDYELEKVAMQRAAELVLRFSDRRPNGYVFSTCGGAYSTNESRAELIFYGKSTYNYGSASTMFAVWRRDTSRYSGQGDRRRLLSEDYTSVGIGCFLYEGYYYWTLEFSSKNRSSTATAANNSTMDVAVEVEADFPVVEALGPEIHGTGSTRYGPVGTSAYCEVAADRADSFQWYSMAPGSSTWQKVSESSGTTAKHTFTLERKHNGCRFKCIVSNQYGSAESEVLTILVCGQPPAVLKQPKSVSVEAGKTAEFTVEAI